MRHEKTFCVLILAAGKGTRMRSDTPKVMHKILEEPILYYLLAAVSQTGISEVGVVVGSGGGIVEKWLSEEFPDARTIWQKEQLGTGHAAKLAQEWWKDYDNVMILPGDTPLLTCQTLKELAESHIRNKSQCSVLSFEHQNPVGYGRIIRSGPALCIVEHKDATPEQAECREVNSGIYVFETKALSSVIDDLARNNCQNEYYLTDTLRLISESGGSVEAIKTDFEDELLGINDPRQSAEAAQVMRERILDDLMRRGVKCMDPQTTWIGPKTTVGDDVTIEPNVQIWGGSVIGAHSRIGSFSVLRNVKLAENVTIVGSARINDCAIGEGASVGPFVFMRDGAVLESGAHVGRFVEIKKSRIGAGSKVPHLSYIGDTEIGEKTNIGAGTITCNYDGEKKHNTVIGNNCFIGSDTILVAPVKVDDNATTGAGSVITSDVPEGALGIGRSKQRNIEGWKARRRGEKKGGEKDVGRFERG